MNPYYDLTILRTKSWYKRSPRFARFLVDYHKRERHLARLLQETY